MNGERGTRGIIIPSHSLVGAKWKKKISTKMLVGMIRDAKVSGDFFCSQWYCPVIIKQRCYGGVPPVRLGFRYVLVVYTNDTIRADDVITGLRLQEDMQDTLASDAEDKADFNRGVNFDDSEPEKSRSG